MPEGAREIWITGIGILSSLGEGVEAHWNALDAGEIRANTSSHAPYAIHPLAPVDFDKQIPKKGDQRQMEAWQRIGTYAAGLALEDAGLKGNADLLSRMDMIVAAGGGERDLAVDSAILSGLPKANDPGAFLNERLMNDLRPTLFLAQLSNLLAGNISIVHGVTGSSRTFMGEEAAGTEAVRVAAARIASGQSDMVLVGGGYNAERKDLLVLFGFAGFPWAGEPVGVWQRGPQGGFSFGSLGAFLVLEEREHARARGAAPRARLSRVVSGWTRRSAGKLTQGLEDLYSALAPSVRMERCAIISGASGAEPATSEERSFLAAHPQLPVRAPATYLGTGMDAQFLMNIGIGAITVGHGRLFKGGDRSGVEKNLAGDIRQAVVTGVAHWRGEAMALVEKVD